MRGCCLFLAGMVLAWPAGGEPLTLDAAIAEALASSSALAARSAQVDQAGEEAAALKTRLLPKLQFELMGGYLLDEVEFVFPRGALGVYPATGPIPGDDIPIVAGDQFTVLGNLQIAQPLSQLLSIRLATRASEAGQKVAAAELASARLELVAAVTELYFGLLETGSSLRSGGAALARLRELVRQLEELAEKQVVLPADLLEAKLALASREHQQRVLENAEISRREELLRLLGRPLDGVLELAELPPPAPYEGSLEQARKTALAARPDLEVARHRAEQAELAARAEKAGRWPELSLALQYVTPYQLDPLPDHIASLGLQFSWEPWDWGRRRHEVAAREATARAARAPIRYSCCRNWQSTPGR